MTTAVQICLQMMEKQQQIADGDGYPDYMDLCPTQAETFNGIDDKDGCPDDDVLH